MVLTSQFYWCLMTGRSTQLIKADKKQAIMQAAEKLFTSRRFHEITLDEVAQAAKVGKGTIYRYFQDKDDLFFETATSGFGELCDLVANRVPQDEPFGPQLLAVCQQISLFFERRRQLFQMMQSEEGRMTWLRGDLQGRWMTRRKALVEALAVVLRKGVAEGNLRADVPAEVLANILLGMLRTRARDLADAPAPFREIATIVSLFRGGADTQKIRPA